MNADVQARIHEAHVRENRYEYWCPPCREPLPLVIDDRPAWIRRLADNAKAFDLSRDAR